MWEIDEDPVCDDSGNCVDFDAWIQALNPVQIGFELIEQGTGGFRAYSVSDGLGFSAPHLTCTGNRLIKVRWFFRAEMDTYIVSPWSSDVPVPCVAPGHITPVDYVNVKLPQFLAINMPLIEAKLTYAPNECMTHLPANFQNAAGLSLFCDIYGDFYTGTDGDHPRPYFVWEPLKWCLSNYASGGTEASGCKSYDEWLGYDGTLGFSILETSASDFIYYKINTAHLTTFTPPPLFCKGTRTINVRMFFYTSDGITIASQWSNPVTIPCDG